MELLGFLGLALVVFLVLSGPIALIWCIVLSSRLNAAEQRCHRLDFLLQKALGQGIFRREAKLEAQPKPEFKPEPEPKPAENILVAMQRAKEQAAAPIQKTEETPAVETKPEIFTSVPPPKLTTTAKSEKSEQPAKPAPEAKSSRRLLDDLEFEKAHPTVPAKEGDFAWQSIEFWIGRYLLGWVAVAAFIVSAALFIIHAVNEGWIGRIPPSIRCLAIAAFGGCFLVAGKYFHRIGWQRFSTMLSSAGVIIVFQAGYASFAYFELISTQAAGVLMSLVVLGSFLLSWHYASTLLGALSIVGGLAVPILLSTGTDRYPEFFTYLAILNLGSVMLVNLLRRPPIGILAFVGTQLEFWLWHHQHYIEPVATEKIVAVLLFQGSLYVIWLLDTTIAAMVPRTLLDFGAALRNATSAEPHEKGDVTEKLPSPKIVTPSWDDVFRAVMAPIVLFGTVWWLLRDDPVFGPWLGVAAFVGSAWYALLAVLYTRHLARIWRPEIDAHFSAYWKAGPAAATVLSLSFLAAGIPLHFNAEWLALAWTTVFAGLWYFGHRQENRTFLAMSAGFMLLGAGRLLYDIFVQGFDPARLGERAAFLTARPMLDVYVLPSLAAILVALVSSVSVDRLLKVRNRGPERNRNFWVGLTGCGFLTLFLSVESVRFFLYRPALYVPAPHWASFSLTVLWSAAALALLEIGVTFRSLLLRRAALVGMFAVAGKMILFDFFSRYQFETPIANPFCPALIGCSLLLIAVAVQSRTSSRFDETEKPAWGVLGITGIFTFLGILSVECYEYFLRNPIPLPVPLETVDETAKRLFATEMLSLLWTVYAAVLLVLGSMLKAKPLRACGLVVMALSLVKFAALELVYRPDYATAFLNPYFLTILCPVAAALAVAVWTTRFRPLEDPRERDGFLALGLAGLLLLWIVLSIECYTHFYVNPFSHNITRDAVRMQGAIASLSVLWAALASVLLVLGLSLRSPVLRVGATIVFAAAAVKILVLEMFRRPAFETPVLNAFFLPILTATTAMIVAAVWTTRFRPLEDDRERNGFLALGIAGIALLWGAMSIECFDYFNIRTEWPYHRQLALASLTVFWTGLAVLLALIAARTGSKTLRILAVLLIVLAFLKVLPYELWNRPGYMTPFLNPHAAPLGLLAFAMIFVCVALISQLGDGEEFRTEKESYRFLAFTGVVLLWAVMSLECFKAVRILQDAESEAWKAQMALSILWSLFAGVLIFTGFVWRSSVLRWMAILLFAVTLTKVMIVDMAGVHQMYRFGAVFVLAVVLSLAAWAYQRFRPER